MTVPPGPGSLERADAVGFPNAPLLPNFDPTSLVGHVVCGVVLGAIVLFVQGR